MKNKTLAALCLGIAFLGCSKSSQNKKTDYPWWKETVIYQIYPRSFKDTNGDGIGDLKGIIEKLDYIKDLGVGAVWLNPVYSSPNADNGYDVSDYKNIMTDFGSMDDFDLLLSEMHKRNLKLIMDIVVNHSSDEHEWFKNSRSSRNNPYREYYHWWPAEKGKPNYRYSLFDVKGDAWKYDSLTNAYYLHYFSEKQPDLNWNNPKLRKEVNDIMIFWAKKGVDGFRLDAFQFAAKDPNFPKFPDGYEKNFIQYYAMQNGLHGYLKEMNSEVFTPFNTMSVSEGAGRNFVDAHELVDEDRNELNMAYAFEGVDIAKYEGYKLTDLKKVFSKWDSAFAEKGWLSVFLANHDQARMLSRFGNDSPDFRNPSAKMLQTFILSMRGTPYCYYGDELGMSNLNFNKIEQYQDIQAKNSYAKALSEGQDMGYFMKKLSFESRDNGRSPMQWTSEHEAGFTTAKPWLPVNPNFKTVNVSSEEKDAASNLNYFKKMVNLRKENPILIHGKYELLLKDHPNIYAYTRTLGKEKILVLLNFSKEKSSVHIKEMSQQPDIWINNYQSLESKNQTVSLLPYQACIMKL
ncbi:glycoside hydrolase family 13 protein [Lacihabitans lacunae]|uniref:Alpha-glucosidase n=1 Tax=Lacihabitans lacunae TaxID=1028214 RepID=A0ABV7YUF0_9BACT